MIKELKRPGGGGWNPAEMCNKLEHCLVEMKNNITVPHSPVQGAGPRRNITQFIIIIIIIVIIIVVVVVIIMYREETKATFKKSRASK